MRAVFDSSVVIKGSTEPGAARRAFNEILWGRVQLIISEPILGEIRSVLKGRNFGFSPAVADLYCSGLAHRDNTKVVRLRDVPVACEADPMDDHVLATAVAGHADVIVSTDHHLRDMKTYRGIPIVGPEEFLLMTGVVKTIEQAHALNRPRSPRGHQAPEAHGEGLAA